MTLGVIEEGSLQGKRIILEPRTGLKKNEWLIEKAPFLNGSPSFALYCLTCEKEIPAKGCFNCI